MSRVGGRSEAEQACFDSSQIDLFRLSGFVLSPPPPASPVSVFCDDGLPGPATLKLGAILTCGVLSAIRPAVRDQSAVSRTPGSPAASIVAP